MTRRIMFHVQHLLGSGHLHRAARLARALDAAGFAVTLASGGEPVPGLDCGGAELVQLPSARATDASFATLVDAYGMPVDDAWRAARAAAVMQIFQNTAPDALLIEMFPFGRRKFAFELMPLLEIARTRIKRPLIAVSVRDIVIASRKPGVTGEAIARLSAYVDVVLVHGDPAFLPFTQHYPAAQQIASKLVYTGYVGPVEGALNADGGGEIVVSAGGGAAGQKLLSAALAARALSRRASAHLWRVLVGASAAGGLLMDLQRRAPDGIIVEAARPDFPGLLLGCACSISQAGYNTVTDVLRAGAKAVLVPFADGNELEQTMRADALAKTGRAVILRESALGPQSLADAVDQALGKPLAPVKIDLNGAAATVDFFMQRERSAGSG